MLRSGFEPESSARKAEMIGRATLPEQHKIAKERYTSPNLHRCGAELYSVLGKVKMPFLNTSFTKNYPL